VVLTHMKKHQGTSERSRLWAEAVSSILSADPPDRLSVGEQALRHVAWQPFGQAVEPHVEHQRLFEGARDVPAKPGGGPKRNYQYQLKAYNVFSEAKWSCQWCGVRVIAGTTLRELSRWFPRSVPYHRNAVPELTHPEIRYRWPSIDHDVPGSSGQVAWEDLDNLLCACWACNLCKGARSGAELGINRIKVAANPWDGLASAGSELKAGLKSSWYFSQWPIPPLEELPRTRTVRDTSPSAEDCFNQHPILSPLTSLLEQFAERWGLSIKDKTTKTREYGLCGWGLLWVYRPKAPYHHISGGEKVVWNFNTAAFEGHLLDARQAFRRAAGREVQLEPETLARDLLDRWADYEPVLRMLTAAAKATWIGEVRLRPAEQRCTVPGVAR
jgi:hypothetical protein